MSEVDFLNIPEEIIDARSYLRKPVRQELCSCVICSMTCNHSTSGEWQRYRLVQTSDYQAINKVLCLHGIMIEGMAPSWCGVAYQMFEKIKEGGYKCR